MEMDYVVGFGLALGVFGFARWTRFDRERAFYSTILIVVASYYVLFAALAGSAQVIVVESIGTAAFALVAVVGFRRWPWLVIAGLAGHGVFDFFHAAIVGNPGVPDWWPGFCLAFDVGVAAMLAVGRVRARDELSYSKVRALTRVAANHDEDLLLAYALDATASPVEERCRQLRNAEPESACGARNVWGSDDRDHARCRVLRGRWRGALRGGVDARRRCKRSLRGGA
jgi:hypothetical protein